MPAELVMIQPVSKDWAPAVAAYELGGQLAENYLVIMELADDPLLSDDTKKFILGLAAEAYEWMVKNLMDTY